MLSLDRTCHILHITLVENDPVHWEMFLHVCVCVHGYYKDALSVQKINCEERGHVGEREVMAGTGEHL